MAERSNATSKKNQDAAQDVSTLQKRGRRRLVGAIALVLLAVIVLPMVFDPEPRQNAPAVSVRIPNEEGSKFTPKVAPKPAAPQPESAAPAQQTQPSAPAPAAKPEPVVAAAPETPKADAKPEPKAAAKPVEKPAPKSADVPAAKVEPKAETRPPEKKAAPPAPKPAEKTAAPAAGAGEQFVVQVGAFADPEKVKERVQQIKAAKLAYYTEPVATANGTVTRIRLGPFASKEAAEKAHARAKALGFNPSNPIAK